MKNRSIATLILLTLVTCGIYGLYYTYVSAQELENEIGEQLKFSPVILVVLCLCLGVVGYVLYGMTMNEALNKVREKKGLPAVDNQVIYMVLGFVFPLILLVLVQNEINKLTDESL